MKKIVVAIMTLALMLTAVSAISFADSSVTTLESVYQGEYNNVYQGEAVIIFAELGAAPSGKYGIKVKGSDGAELDYEGKAISNDNRFGIALYEVPAGAYKAKAYADGVDGNEISFSVRNLSEVTTDAYTIVECADPELYYGGDANQFNVKAKTDVTVGRKFELPNAEFVSIRLMMDCFGVAQTFDSSLIVDGVEYDLDTNRDFNHGWKNTYFDLWKYSSLNKVNYAGKTVTLLVTFHASNNNATERGLHKNEVGVASTTVTEGEWSIVERPDDLSLNQNNDQINLYSAGTVVVAREYTMPANATQFRLYVDRYGHDTTYDFKVAVDGVTYVLATDKVLDHGWGNGVVFKFSDYSELNGVDLSSKTITVIIVFKSPNGTAVERALHKNANQGE